MGAEQERRDGRARRPGRLLALDIPLALVLGAVVLVWTHGQAYFAEAGAVGGGASFGAQNRGEGFPPPGALLGVGTYLTILAAILATMVRRLWPRIALIGCAAAVIVFLALGNPYGPMMFLLAFVMFSAAAHLPLRRFLPWSPLVVVVAVVGHAQAPYLGFADLSTVLGMLGAVVAFGIAGTFGVLLRARRESARRERIAELDRHAYSERLRIAREVHDVVGHSLSVINMQAGVALHVLGKRPEQSAVALGVIRATSKEALDELRGALAVFRDGTEPARAPEAPVSGLVRLDDLVESVSTGGRQVHCDVQGESPGVSATVDHAAYRIIQEALTNAVRHAGNASVWVTVRYAAEDLVVDVVDDGAARPDKPPREGNGLAGMRERAEAVGGRFRAAPRAEGGFQVHAELPMNRARGHEGRDT